MSWTRLPSTAPRPEAGGGDVTGTLSRLVRQQPGHRYQYLQVIQLHDQYPSYSPYSTGPSYMPSTVLRQPAIYPQSIVSYTDAYREDGQYHAYPLPRERPSSRDMDTTTSQPPSSNSPQQPSGSSGTETPSRLQQPESDDENRKDADAKPPGPPETPPQSSGSQTESRKSRHGSTSYIEPSGATAPRPQVPPAPPRYTNFPPSYSPGADTRSSIPRVVHPTVVVPCDEERYDEEDGIYHPYPLPKCHPRDGRSDIPA